MIDACVPSQSMRAYDSKTGKLGDWGDTSDNQEIRELLAKIECLWDEVFQLTESGMCDCQVNFFNKSTDCLMNQEDCLIYKLLSMRTGYDESSLL